MSGGWSYNTGNGSLTVPKNKFYSSLTRARDTKKPLWVAGEHLMAHDCFAFVTDCIQNANGPFTCLIVQVVVPRFVA